MTSEPSQILLGELERIRNFLGENSDQQMDCVKHIAAAISDFHRSQCLLQIIDNNLKNQAERRRLIVSEALESHQKSIFHETRELFALQDRIHHIVRAIFPNETEQFDEIALTFSRIQEKRANFILKSIESPQTLQIIPKIIIPSDDLHAEIPLASQEKLSKAFTLESFEGYVPNSTTLCNIGNYINNGEFLPSIDLLYADLQRTYAELLSEYRSVEPNYLESHDASMFVHPDSIKRLSQYQQLEFSMDCLQRTASESIKSLSISTAALLDSISTFSDQLKSKLVAIGPCLEDLSKSTEEHAKIECESLQIQIFKDALKQSGFAALSQPAAQAFIDYRKNFFRRMIDSAKTGQYDQMKAFSEDAFQGYDDLSRHIDEDLKKLKDSKNKNMAELTKRMKQVLRPKDSGIQRNIEIMGKRLSESKAQFSSLYDGCVKSVVSVVENISKLCKERPDLSLLPIDLKQLVHNQDESKRLWMKQRLDERRKLVHSRKRALEEDKRHLEKTRKEVEENRKLFEDLKKKSTESKPTIAITTEMNELKDQYICPVCQSRPREQILPDCNHTFCKYCLEELVKNRSRKCPCCGTKFSPNHIRDIAWN